MKMVMPIISQEQFEVLRKSISDIADTNGIEKVICYGVRTSNLESWSCFESQNEKMTSAEYDLLVITKEKQTVRRNEISQVIHDLSNVHVGYVNVAHSVDVVNDGLQEENFFFTSLYHQGVLVYDSGAVTLTPPSSNKIPVRSEVSIESDWNKWSGLSKNFYEGATEAIAKKALDLAAFMLHQCVEHICIALIRTFMGYRSSTHKLEKLLTMVENFCFYSVSVFPRLTKEEIRLFDVLEHAYVDARYKRDYVIEPHVISALQSEVKEMLDVAEALYIKRLKRLKQKSKNTFYRELSPFESICLDTFADVVLKKGEKEEIRIECEQTLFNAIVTSVEDNRLWVSTARTHFDTSPVGRIYITYTALTGLAVNHSGDIHCEEPIDTFKLGIVQNGNGNIDLAVELSMLDVTLTKSGSVTITGTTDELKVSTHRSGSFEGRNLEADSANITIRGSGHVSICIDDELYANLHGSGNLYYRGTPRIRSLVSDGTGTLKQL